MGKITYDFREGLDSEKIVYKNKSVNWKEGLYYTGYLLLTWMWTVGWFALFQYAYILHEPTAFWAYIGVWLAFMIFMMTFIIYNLVVYYKARAKKMRKVEEEEIKKTENERKLRDARENKRNEIERPIENILTTQNNNEKAKLNQP